MFEDPDYVKKYPDKIDNLLCSKIKCINDTGISKTMNLESDKSSNKPESNKAKCYGMFSARAALN